VSALHSNYEEHGGGGLWTSLNRFLAVLIVVTVLAAVFYRYMPEFGAEDAEKAKIEALTHDVNELRQLHERLLRQESLLKRDPEYIALIARDKLDLMKEGETIFRDDPARPDPSKMRLHQ
jgi:cell division protein FtsB